MQELQEDVNKVVGTVGEGSFKKGEFIFPQLSVVPELYDHLIQARLELNEIPNPPVLSGAVRCGVTVRRYEKNQDCVTLMKACNG